MLRKIVGVLVGACACTVAPGESVFEPTGGSATSGAETGEAGSTTSTVGGESTADETASEASSASSLDGSGSSDATTATTATSTTDASASSSGESSSTGPVDTCGDGVVDAGEACDDVELGGEDCMSQGFLAGELACADDCTLDTSGCSMPVCEEDPPPLGGVCPPECSGGCDMATETCNIDCSGNDCDNAVVQCPAAWACFVHCDGTAACAGTTIECPDHACSISCDGTVACEDAVFDCGAATCTVDCYGTAPCDGATLECGIRDSMLTCSTTNASPSAVADPASSCACETIDC